MLRRLRAFADQPERGYLRSALGWGALLSVVFTLATPLAAKILPINWLVSFPFQWWLFVLLVNAPPFLAFAARSSLHSSRLLPVLGANLAFLAGYLAAYRIRFCWGGLSIGITPLRMLLPDPRVLVFTLFLTLVGAVTVFVLLHAVIFKASRQAGRFCNKCGYDLSGLDGGSRCPECGTARDQPTGSRLLRRADGVLGRFAIPIVLATVAIGALGYGFRWFREVAPIRDRLRRLGATEFFDTWTESQNNLKSSFAYGGFIPMDDPRGLGLVVAVPRGQPNPPRTVQIRIAAIHRFWTGQAMLSLLSPHVTCDLDDRQTLHVLDAGIPTALIDEFKRNAPAVLFPTTTESPLLGYIKQVAASGAAPILIDPKPYFSGPESGTSLTEPMKEGTGD